MSSAASRPWATAVTVRSSPPAAQSPPAQTFGFEVRPSASILMRPLSIAIVWPDPFSGAASNDWPIARDVADYLAVDVPEDEEDSEPIGDLDLFADVGVSEIEVEALCEDLDSEPLEVVESIVEKLGYTKPYDRVAAEFDL